jgi:hypothetical protein
MEITQLDSIRPFNKKQILLDWINTVDEPKCLLVSEIDQLKDGIVFLEILKNYLKKIENLKIYQNEIKNAISQSQDIKSRYDLIYRILLEFFEKEDIRRFQPVGKLFNNQNYLLEFIEVFKSLFDGFSGGGYISNEENENFENFEQVNQNFSETGKSMSMFSNQMIESEFDLKTKYFLPSPKNKKEIKSDPYQNNFNKKGNENLYEMTEKNENEKNQINEETFRYKNDIYEKQNLPKSKSPEKKIYNFNQNFVKKNFESDSDMKEKMHYNNYNNYNNYNYHNSIHQRENFSKFYNTHEKQNEKNNTYNPHLSQTQKALEVSKLNFDILQDNKNPISTYSKDVDYTFIGKEYLKMKSPEKKERENIFKENSSQKKINFKKMIHNHEMSLSTSAIKNKSISPLHTKEDNINNVCDTKDRSLLINTSIISQTNLNFDFNSNSLYSNREKSEMFLFRGIPFPQNNLNNNKINIIDINNHRVNFFRFIRPTLPIVNVDFKTCCKFKPNDGYVKNSVKKILISQKLNDREIIAEITERTERTERMEKFTNATFSSFNYLNKPTGKKIIFFENFFYFFENFFYFF